MKHLLSSFLLLSLLFISNSVFAQEATPTDSQLESKIRVAVYEDWGIVPKAKFWFPALLRSDPQIQWEHVTCKKIQDGCLDNFDILIVPGGMSDTMVNHLEDKGVNNIKSFIRSGKGYIGFCAGAYLTMKAKFFNAQTKTTYWWRGKTYIDIEMSELGLKVFGDKFKGIWECRYGNGPIVNINTHPCMAPVEILAYFRSEITDSGAAPGIQLDSPAILISTYGKGTVLTFSPHPEATPELNQVILQAIHHVEKSVQCAVCNEQCAKCNVQCATCSCVLPHDWVNALFFTPSDDRFAKYCTLHTAHCSLHTLREQTVSYMCSMAQIEWTPSRDIPWFESEEKSVTPPATDATEAVLKYNEPKTPPKFVYRAGQTYKGLPYTSCARYSNLERFQTVLKDENGKQVYYGSVNPQQYFGNGCSTACCFAWKSVLPRMPLLRTPNMVPGEFSIINPETGLAEPLFIKVGNYKITNIDNSKTVCKDNGEQVMFDSYSQLLPGDAIILRPAGKMAMVTRVDTENKKVYVIEQSGLNDKNQLVSENSSWRIDYEYTFQQLFEKGYIPVSPRGLN